jgi:glutamine cyclotransferase
MLPQLWDSGIVRRRTLLLPAIAAVLASCNAAPASEPVAGGGVQVDEPGYVKVAEFPHDPGAYTQGLEFRGTELFEGTGLEGRSSLRRVDLETGEVLEQVDLKPDQFGEGITIFGGRIYQLTWQDEKCFVYDADTLERVRRFRYEGEGWGLTHNRRRLVMSDGSNVIRFRDPKTFAVVREIDVTRDDGEPVSLLNELEWVDGEIFANVWTTDEVVRIDPATGDVTGSLDLSALRQEEEMEGDPEVTNGIAYMKVEDRLFVTGKLWSHIYEIELADLLP